MNKHKDRHVKSFLMFRSILLEIKICSKTFKAETFQFENRFEFEAEPRSKFFKVIRKWFFHASVILKNGLILDTLTPIPSLSWSSQHTPKRTHTHALTRTLTCSHHMLTHTHTHTHMPKHAAINIHTNLTLITLITSAISTITNTPTHIFHSHYHSPWRQFLFHPLRKLTGHRISLVC